MRIGNVSLADIIFPTGQVHAYDPSLSFFVIGSVLFRFDGNAFSSLRQL